MTDNKDTVERAAVEEISALSSPQGLSPEERLVWLLGDMMNAAENFYGAPNPKREGHIYSAANRIIDEVIEPIRALPAAPSGEVERLREALERMLHAVCGETGFANAVRNDSGYAYPWLALDEAEFLARAALHTDKEQEG